MAREKNRRTLNFKPLVKSFGPLEKKSDNQVALLHEEIEAIYLMDLQGLYQADAAEKMGVSRPTFSRIISNARHKVATALVSGANLIINDQKEDYTVAFCSADEKVYDTITPAEQFLLIYHIDGGKVIDIDRLTNPVFEQDGKPGQLLPAFLLEHHVNFFISSNIGEGLKNSLLAKGISPVTKRHVDVATLLSLGFLEEEA